MRRYCCIMGVCSGPGAVAADSLAGRFGIMFAYCPRLGCKPHAHGSREERY